MNSDNTQVQQKATTEGSGNPKPQVPATPLNTGDPLVDLVNTMGSVDVNDPKAEANVTSIDDNNGGRIQLTDESVQPKKDEQTFQKVIK